MKSTCVHCHLTVHDDQVHITFLKIGLPQYIAKLSRRSSKAIAVSSAKESRYPELPAVPATKKF